MYRRFATFRGFRAIEVLLVATLVCSSVVRAQELEAVTVEGQPLAANVERVVRAFRIAGCPASARSRRRTRNCRRCATPERFSTFSTIACFWSSPSIRRSASRSAAAQQAALLQQGGYVPVLVKVLNQAATTKALRITSPQSGLVTSGAADLSMSRQDQAHLKKDEVKGGAPGRFLQVEMVTPASP